MENKNVRYYKISEEDLLYLLAAAGRMEALEQGGVDNWEWESESRHNYLDEIGYKDFESMAKVEITGYEQIN